MSEYEIIDTNADKRASRSWLRISALWLPSV
jgi:hypothetical protein